MVVKRERYVYADLSPDVGSEQGGIRPVLIIQNDVETNIVLQEMLLQLDHKLLKINYQHI